MNSTVYIALSIIGTLVFFAFAVSWVSRYKRKENQKKLMQEFDDFVIKNNLSVDKKQTLNKNMIGLDRQNMKLVFFENTSASQQIHQINLQDLSTCRLIKQCNKTSGHISSISLQLIFKHKNKPAIILPVYDEFKDDLYKMMRLSKKASYWEKTINIFREVA